MGSICLFLCLRIQHILVDGKSSRVLRRLSSHSCPVVKVMYSPLEYPFDASTFNFAILIIGYVTFHPGRSYTANLILNLVVL